MNITLKSKNTQVTEALKEYIDKRFSKLEKYFTEELRGTVTLIVERELHRVEVTIPINRFILRAEEESTDMYASIDNVIDKIERQIRKYKTRVNKKNKLPIFEVAPLETEEQPVYEDIKIIKTKSFQVKPMDEEEAVMQMELIGHDFFVFLNVATDTINVVYKRNDEKYGLIQPVIH